MASFNVFSRQCPVCHAVAVVKNGGSDRIRGATHRCSNCGTQLKVVATPYVLWSIPAMVLVLGLAYALFSSLKGSAMFNGALRAAVDGGIGALCLSLVLNVAARGLVFKPASAREAKA
jgi:hypothetical protein